MRSLVSLLLCGAAVAQATNHTAYSIDALHGVFGHWAFFGVLSTGNSDECRAQLLIPEVYLPGAGGVLVAVDVAPHVEGTITYQRLDLAFGASNLTALSTDMNANLPTPTQVYSAAPGTVISWPSRTQWVRINLTTPFFFNGGSGLVFESRRVIDRPGTAAGLTVSHQMSSGPSRNDLPRPVWSEGPAGSNRSNNQFGNTYSGPHMLIRLVWAGVPTLTITGPRVNGSYYRLGQSMTLTVNGTAGDLFATMIDTGLAPAPTTFGPILGNYFLATQFNVLTAGFLGAGGSTPYVINLPVNPVLAGLKFHFQSVTAGAAIVWTNSVDAILQPQ